MDLKHAFPRRVRDAVIIASDGHHAFMADPPFNSEDGIVRDRGQRLQAELLLNEGLIYHTQSRGMHPRVRNTCPREIRLGVQIVDIAERTRQKEVLTDVTKGPLNLALGLCPIRSACARDRAIMVQQRNQGRVVSDNPSLIFADHCRLHTIIENVFR